ncbi:conserved Plasmodium protein, unknown function [Plasmodium ovale]|uniref:Uncharacterized protein n=1 Tax=Plasmodium ovale TaxID=36330 RepID=A0A1D3TI81_PLAOA|nr:conserved Plasmodium protein, unknown function [Plasmodium ovale]
MNILHNIYIVFMFLFSRGDVLFGETSIKESNFFNTKFYNNKLSKPFHENDYHFFRLVFIKLLTENKVLRKNVTIDDVVKIMEAIKFTLNKKNDEIYMTLYEEVKSMSLKQYKEIYEKGNINREIEKEIPMGGEQRRYFLHIVPFPKEQTFKSNDIYKKIQLLLDILYTSIVTTYQPVDNEGKRNMLMLMYENVINQWMNLNFLRKIMQYSLYINRDRILFYISLEKRKNTDSIKKEDINYIEIKLRNILDEYVHKLYPTYLGSENNAFVIDRFTEVYLPYLCVIGYMTSSEDNLDPNEGMYSSLEATDNFSMLNSGSQVHRKNYDLPANFFDVQENANKIIIQVLLSSPNQKRTWKGAEVENTASLTNGIDAAYPTWETSGVHFSVENAFNILADHFMYNEDFSLRYEAPSLIVARYLFGDSQNMKLKKDEEEKKYEDISLHIFVRIIGIPKFTFKHVQKFILKNTAYISMYYYIHFYGACIKHSNTDMIKVIGQFGEGIDNNLISNVIIKMNVHDMVAHIKLFSKKRKDNTLHYVTTKEIKEQLNKSVYFKVIYYIVDSTKEIPAPINCSTCRHFKYHYIVLFSAAIIPSLLLLLTLYFICYCKGRKCTNSKKTRFSRLSHTHPRLFYVRTASNQYRRLDIARNLLHNKQKKSVIKKGFKNKRGVNFSNGHPFFPSPRSHTLSL